eukprot:Skav202927  [mRNA]  locus=scaffold1565:320662:321756:- [translate_table: standard]
MPQQMQETTRQHIPAKRIWSTRGSATSKALYEIAATPHRALKETIIEDEKAERKSKRDVDKEAQELLKQMQALSIQMQKDLEQLKAGGASSADQLSNQQEALQQQVQKLADIARRHDDEIDDLRGMTDYTHELVVDRESKENSLKMVIKSWPQEATYADRVRITDWLLQKAQVENQTRQEHGYYTAGRRFTLSPVTVLTFKGQDAQQSFERFAYTSFSGKHPLHYWDAYGNRLQHYKGGWHKIVITKYLGKTDLVINMALTTAQHILTSQADSQYSGTTHLSHRTSDKQLYDLHAKKVIAKATYDKDRGVLAIIAQGDLVNNLRNYWHEVHKDHPRYPSYNRYPYAVTFAAARLEDEDPGRGDE